MMCSQSFLVLLYPILIMCWSYQGCAQNECTQITSALHDTQLPPNTTRLVCHFVNKDRSKVHVSFLLVYGLSMEGTEQYGIRGDTMTVDLRPGTYSMCAYTSHPADMSCLESHEFKEGEVSTICFTVGENRPKNTTYKPLELEQWGSGEISRDSVDENAVEVALQSLDSTLPISNTSAYITIKAREEDRAEPLIVYVLNTNMDMAILQVLKEPPYRLALPSGSTKIWIWRENSKVRGSCKTTTLRSRYHYAVQWNE